MDEIERLYSREVLEQLRGRRKGLEWIGDSIIMVVWRLPLVAFGFCCASVHRFNIGIILLVFGGSIDPRKIGEWKYKYAGLLVGAYAFLLIVCDTEFWVAWFTISLYSFLTWCGSYLAKNRHKRLENKRVQDEGYVSA